MRAFTLLALLPACAAPDIERMFNSLSVDVSADEATANAFFIEAIDGAESSLHLALPRGDDLDVAEALIAAMDREVEIELIVDIDQQDAPAIAALIDAGVPTTLADDAVAYFDFNLGEEVNFPSIDCVMSHAFVVADRARIVSASSFGGLGDSPQVVYSLTGEEIVEDLLWEHNQIYGGVDATTVTAYDANAKSIADPRWGYMLPQPIQVGVFFGPQERLLKRVIDSVYGARSSVRIMTPTFANPELAKALQDKVQWGLEVEVIVGASFVPDDADVRTWFYAADDVAWRRADGDDFPTLVLVDYEPDALGFVNMPRGMVLTHGLLSGSRIYRAAPTPSDQLIDGTLWVLDQTEAPSAELLQLLDLYTARRDDSEAL